MLRISVPEIHLLRRSFTTGFGATYDLNDNVMLVAGFHEGMTPMFGAEPEEADNMN